VDSVCWVGANSMVASGLWFDADSGGEGDDAFPLAITWSSWAGTEDAAPQDLQVVLTGSYFPMPVSRGGGTCPERHRGAVLSLFVRASTHPYKPRVSRLF
jgi:hypothetical protein